MPPIYSWECRSCKQSAEVIRPLARFDEPPTGEESPPPVQECSPAGHDWERIHTHAPRTIKGPSWNGSKGNWLLLLGFLAASIGLANSACGRDKDHGGHGGKIPPGMTHEPPDDEETDPGESTATGTNVQVAQGTTVVVTVTQNSDGGATVYLPDGSTAQVQLGTSTGTSTGCR